MLIDFDWSHDSAGYAFDSDRTHIVRKGGRLVPSRPFEAKGSDVLFAAFARIETPEQVKTFAEAHGTLITKDGGDEIAYALAWASWFRDVLRYKQQGWSAGLRERLVEEPNDP